MRSGRVPIDVDITGATNLWLVVTDAGDGYNCDWADWIEPKLIRADGSAIFLTELPWKSASAGWGKANINKNCKGGPLKMDKRNFAIGIGTHAPSIIEYDLTAASEALGREPVVRFQCRAGPDMAGVDQNCGTSIEFLVFTEPPPPDVLNSGAASAEIKFGSEAAREAIGYMAVAEGLEVSVFAAEPLLRNPTNIDIDHRGRIWVAEAANYRGTIRPWGTLEPAGDRIVILEDTTGDGTADVSKVFYQDPGLNAPLGICVLGNRVVVSASPEIFILIDDDADDRADRKEVLFTGIGGVDDDHGVHAVVFGPDGKLYFNFGDRGGQLKRPDGSPVVDVFGNEVSGNGKPFRRGMAFRCNPDGSEVEVLGHNFRNPYELAVDSFGTVWQSDNDDDGNRSVRINYMMPFGNYGYTDEMTGAGWTQKRTNIESEVPQRHWHQNDPGSVPNLLITGAGSPTGISIYEGKLLPESFQNQIIHCDAGPRIVRAYSVQPDGAGYSATTIDILSSSESWFRPADVCVAPDGSLYVADWCDAVVGGHNFVDRDVPRMRGRIYRIAPKGHKPVTLRVNFTRIAGTVAALQSPNHATRYLAWQELHALGAQTESELLKLWRSGDPRMRARALHLLARMDGRELVYVEQAAADSDPDIRITGLRIARQLKLDLIPILRSLVKDPSVQVRRECALAVRGDSSAEAPELWAELALQHDGKDRWYLEALGIGSTGREDECFAAWLNKACGDWNTPAGRDIIWRTRSRSAPAYLAKLILDPNTAEGERPRYFRALDFIPGESKQQALIELLSAATR